EPALGGEPPALLPERRLADPGLALEHERCRFAALDAVEQGGHGRELGAATDDRVHRPSLRGSRASGHARARRPLMRPPAPVSVTRLPGGHPGSPGPPPL